MANDGSVPGGPVLSVLGEFVVDLLPVLSAGAGPEGIVGQHITAGTGNPYQNLVFQQGVYRQLATEPWYVVITLAAAVMCAWAFRLVLRPPRT